MNSKNKICSKCKIVKKNKEFTKNKTQCKQCINATQNKRRKKRTEWFEKFKKSLKCEHCGNSDFRVLDFDHVDDKKHFNIGDAVCYGMSIETIKKEIKKCQVLCANCHRIKTHEERKIKQAQK